eukprot:scaffold311241_cov33-Prasinocladus_malaysianus.AAC.1
MDWLTDKKIARLLSGRSHITCVTHSNMMPSQARQCRKDCDVQWQQAPIWWRAKLKCQAIPSG